MMRVVLFLAALTFAMPALGQSFSCRGGTEPACLDYGDTVCSRNGMCVDRNSSCFDQFQCNYEGFTCRSNVTECVATYEELLEDHNALVRDYNELLETHNDLVDEHNRNLEISLRLRRDMADMESCLNFASTMDDALLCAR